MNMNNSQDNGRSNGVDIGRYGRIAIFIDGSNLYHTIRDLGIHIDYRRLLTYFSRDGWLLRAFYYTALLEDGTPDWLIRLTDWLSYNGFAVITKRAKVFRRKQYDENGQVYWREEVKGNVDIELAIDMLTLCGHYDTAILFSGDGDFVRLVEAVQRRGVRVVVVSSERTTDSTVADELRRQADEFVDLADVAEAIRMQDRSAFNSTEI
ncbi:MAG: NYN domain-containing protein [Ardenticatenaceae bacterium]|nr:NYN domain-containing protein [Ardenticatenaceae bacterium]